MADKIYLNARFGYREDTLANWQEIDPVLERGEIAFVRDGTDGKFVKIGDGATPWALLPYAPLPKGEKGAQGETGPKGEKGEKGDKGDAGADGKDAVTDQTYNPESENAQSGVAVAEATEWIVLADTTLDETTANVKSVNIEVDKEKADICSEYLFEIEFTIDVDYVSPIFMVCLRTGWANNVLAYSRSSKCSAGATVRAYSFTLRDGKLMYSIYRPLHTSNEFNSTATPETTTSFGYDTENNRRSLDLWFNTEHTFPVGTHIRLIGRR